MIKLENICAGYGGKNILKGVGTEANSGQFIALLGPNGSGKSTLIKTVCGLIKPCAGGVSWDGRDISGMASRERARIISYLSQHREAAPGMLVSDIVALGRAPYRGALGQISEEGRHAIETACRRARVTEFFDRTYASLSGGEQARVLLARALAVSAPVLLLDEPIAALDPFYQLTMMEILKEEADAGRVVIAALHDLGLAQQFASRIWVMESGELVADNTPEEIMNSDIYAAVFGVTPPLGGFQIMSLSKPDRKRARSKS